jgi:hypothetical protein
MGLRGSKSVLFYGDKKQIEIITLEMRRKKKY